MMKFPFSAAVSALLVTGVAAGEWGVHPGDSLSLEGPRDGRQLVLALDGHDVTGEAVYAVDPPGIVSVDRNGYLSPLADGTAIVQVTAPGDEAGTEITVKVSRSGAPDEVSIRHELIPVLTKYGCNGGGCHGKAGGQKGFRLSLFGYEPWNDYDFLVHEGRGRRLSPAAPGNSLVLLKATGELPHEGGARLERGGDHYGLVTDWIAQGMPPLRDEEPAVTGIEVFPGEAVVAAGAHQQLAVVAHFSDGTSRDITRVAVYEPNEAGRCEVTGNGRITFFEGAGTTSVMVRFQEHVAVFRGTIPLGEETGTMPPARNFIDEHLFSHLEKLGIPPSPVAEDAVFLRRVTLDIAGRLPTPDEVARFGADSSPGKRDRVIGKLLASRDHAEFFAQKWAGILRNKRERDEYRRGTFAFHQWIRDSLADNKPYDAFVSELVTARGEVGRHPEVAWYRAVKDPKEQMQDIAQVFLGIRMQCAQCHHHPFDIWSQDDYYSLAAFFSTVGRKAGEQPGEEVVFHRRVAATMTNPNTKKALAPTPLGGEALALQPGDDPRVALAGWLTSPENPWFAKMLVNRYWKHFFGRGMVEPEDDLRITNPATHPELLEELAGHFVESGYDLRALVRTICESRAYQLSSEPNEHNLGDTRNFSRFYPRRLPAEVLLDAINDVAGTANSFTSQPPGVRAVQLPDDRFNTESFFLSVFGRPENASACECERVSDANLAQSLHLINSPTIQEKLAADSAAPARLASDRETPAADRVASLYLSALGRPPTESESTVAVAYLERKRDAATATKDGDAGEKSDPVLEVEREAFEDLLWAIINTKEFLFTH